MSITETPDTQSNPAAKSHKTFRYLPFMGVIRVNEEAAKVGYTMGDPRWSNLGQGQPEVGDIEGAPDRICTIDLEPNDHAYGPVGGTDELRTAVADHYNRLYRKGKNSQYTEENVAISAGGRLALSRCGSALDVSRLGYFTPDYTAYEDLITTFSRIDPVWIELLEENQFRIPIDELSARVCDDSIDALLISNPCNPTGVVIQDQELAAWVDLSRQHNCTLLMDEFYSHYVYSGNIPVSSAEFVDDVNRDRVLIFDGLTKNFRYPGWRIGWMVAPRNIIKKMNAAGSFLDGGPSRPVQRAALQVLNPDRADQETQAVRHVFREKQALTIGRLTDLGIEFPGNPQGTFYAWGKVANLPAPLNTGMGFMHEAFKYQVLTVPGEFFDVNPNQERTGTSPLEGYVRFSFGPPEDNLSAGLDRLGEMIGSFR